ncbi:MAG TPA: carboxypeptidase-like regulatory domain-containing protein [Bryobacteraceae bacterium]|nr:carboxypeptidase-like regulatory domain-containing protein [Bryobacteraceae bacterium]
MPGCYRALSALAALFAFVPLSLAQTASARLEGVVQDTTGAVVPNARVTALNVKTQAVADTVSGPEGTWVLPALLPGIYALSAEAQGFRKTTIQNLELNVGSTVSQVISLDVGTVTESITVEAAAVNVQSTESQISRVVTLRDIDSLPQLGRNPMTLSYFQPGVQIDVRPGQDASYSRVNGLRQGSNNSRLDGIDVNDSVVPRLGLSLTPSNTDSVGEFRIVTTGGKAEYGRSAGAQVELITRTGTNNFHGALFDYLRNTALNANDFFSNQSGQTRPKFIQNTFGGSLGGPILRSRTFFFANFQGRKTIQDVVRNRTVFTREAKQGIFRYRRQGEILSYNFGANDPRGIGPDREIAKLLSLLPAPNNNDVGDGLNTAGFRFNNPAGSEEWQGTGRLDHNLTSDHRLFFRWTDQRTSSIDTTNNQDAFYPGQPHGRQGGRRFGFAIGSDWVVKPNLVNEFRIGRQSASVDFLRPARVKGPMVDFTLLPGQSDPISLAFAQGRNSPVLDITENITWIRGKHTFKGGVNIRRTNQFGYNDAGIYPNLLTTVANGNNVPSDVGPAGLTTAERQVFEQLYNDVLGRISSVAITYYSNLEKFQPAGTPRVRNYGLRESGYFFQDDWRATRRLTLNIGLRYEYYAPPKERDGLQGGFDKAALLDGVSHISDLRIGRTNAWYRRDLNNFAPRFGFAYDLAGDGRTALRGNVGIFYDRFIGSVTNYVDSNTPGFSSAINAFPNQSAGSDRRFADGVVITPPPAAPEVQPPVTRNITVATFRPDLRTGYVEAWSFGVQRELLRNTVLEAAYVGNRGVKLFMDRDINQPRVYEDFVGAFREIERFRATGAAPSPGNTLVRMFGTPQAVLSTLGASNFQLGLVGTVAGALDRNAPNYNRYANAGLNDFYLRNYPQFNLLVLGTNDGRSCYDALQLSLRRSASDWRLHANYTWSKNIDNISVDGNGFTTPIDNRNLRLNRARSDSDRPHSFNATGIYTLPVGRGKRFGADMSRWADALIGGWDLGAIMLWQSGQPHTIHSQRNTTAVSNLPAAGTWANYNGTDRNIGSIDKRGDGVYYFSADQIARFDYPAAGEIGTAGRNAFRGPRVFNIDASLVKRFRVTERQTVVFRAEAYSLANSPIFGLVTANLNLNNRATFGKISSTFGSQNSSTSARILQLALRYEF